MKKYEALAPAGSFDAIIPMIEAGADAIYVGIEGFSSRPKQIDFSLEQIRDAVKLCHNHNVKLYVAVNVGISEKDAEKVKESIFAVDSFGADAVILADYGFVSFFSHKLKNAALHASTLLGAYNIEDARLLRDMNVKRLILYANLYIDEIAAITNAVPELEYELVAEGGTCFNDIRQCLLPHTFINGEHKLFCRERYRLESMGVASPAKPICEYANKVAEVLGVYMGAGVSSFKIEGRTVPYQERIEAVKRVRNAIDSFKKSGSAKAYMHYFSRANREMF